MRIYLNHSVIIFYFILLLNCIPQNSAAQELSGTDKGDSKSIFIQDAKHLVETGYRLLGRPFMFDRQDWARTGLAVCGTALLFTVDKNVKDFALHNQNKLNNTVLNTDSFNGNQYLIFFTCGIYGYGTLAGNSRIRKMGLYATEAFIYSGMITITLKLLIGRRRPYAGKEHLFLRPFQFTNYDYQSLPSGHTTVSFAVSTVLAKSVENSYWKAFWYGIAGLVGASRIYHNKHWLSDVFLGAVIGYAVGDYVVRFDRKVQPLLSGKRVQLYLSLNRVGLCMSLK